MNLDFNINENLSSHEKPPFRTGVSLATLASVTFEDFTFRGGDRKDETTKCLNFTFLDKDKDRQQSLILLYVDTNSDRANDDMLYTQKTIKQIYECFAPMKALKAKSQEELFTKTEKLFSELENLDTPLYLKVFYNSKGYLQIPSKFTNYAFVERANKKDGKLQPTTLYVQPGWDLLEKPEKVDKGLIPNADGSNAASAGDFDF